MISLYFQKHFTPDQFEIKVNENFVQKRILRKDAIPSVFPHLGENTRFYNTAVRNREIIESVLKDHEYSGKSSPSKDIKKKTNAFDATDPKYDVKVEHIDIVSGLNGALE